MQYTTPGEKDLIQIDPAPRRTPQTERQHFIDKLFPKINPEAKSLILPVVLLVVISLLAIILVLLVNRPKKTDPKVTRVLIPTIGPTSTPLSSENWRTYANNSVTFQYPPDLQLESDTTNERSYLSTLSLKSEDGVLKLIFLFGLNMDSSFDELNSFLDKFATSGGRKITIDGQPAATSQINLVQYPTSYTTYLISKDNKSHTSISISINSKENQVTDEAKRIYDQILSTFRFLEVSKDNNTMDFGSCDPKQEIFDWQVIGIVGNKCRFTLPLEGDTYYICEVPTSEGVITFGNRDGHEGKRSDGTDWSNSTIYTFCGLNQPIDGGNY